MNRPVDPGTNLSVHCSYLKQDGSSHLVHRKTKDFISKSNLRRETYFWYNCRDRWRVVFVMDIVYSLWFSYTVCSTNGFFIDKKFQNLYSPTIIIKVTYLHSMYILCKDGDTTTVVK